MYASTNQVISILIQLLILIAGLQLLLVRADDISNWAFKNPVQVGASTEM